MAISFYASCYPKIYRVRPWIAFVNQQALETRMGQTRRFASETAALRAASEYIRGLIDLPTRKRRR